MGTQRKLRVPPHVVTRRVGDETVLLNLHSETYFGLDDVGTAMLEELRAGHTEAVIVGNLLAQFDADHETLRADLAQLIERLLAADLLEEIATA